MTMAKHTRPKFGDEGFPLWKHSSGRWCKKVRGRAVYFGKVADDPKGIAAYQQWLDERDDLLAGKKPVRERQHHNTTEDIVNAYLERCDDRVQSRDLSAVSFNDYRYVGKLIVKHLGRRTDPTHLQPTDFAKFRSAMAAGYSPSRLNKCITVTRQMFKWAHQSRLVDRLPDYGPDFAVASQKVMRRQKREVGKKLLTRDEVEALLNAADVKWKAILLICLNAGFGNSDIARLKLSDIGGEWLSVPRGKTETDRVAWLWPETREAIAAAVKARRTPKPGAEELLFLSDHGGPMLVVRPDGRRTDLTVEGFRRLAQEAGIHRRGMGLYWCRHTFATEGDQAKDRVATMAVLGHVDHSTTGAYVEEVEPERIKAVCQHVRGWLYPQNPKQQRREAKTSSIDQASDARPQLKVYAG
jgi:integrase